MLLELVDWLMSLFGHIPGEGMMRGITFRAGIAVILSLVISMIFGGRIIRYLTRLQIGETVRELGLEGQKQKQGTPTMGGVIIIMAILIPCLLMAKLDNVYVIIMLVATVWMATIGFVDDYIKVFRKNKEGLKGIFKVLGQVVLGGLIALTMIMNEQVVVRMDVDAALEIGLDQEEMVGEVMNIPLGNGQGFRQRADYKTNLTNVPFLKGNRFDYVWLMPGEYSQARKWVWVLFVPFVIFIVTAVSNAANLTDGLDGLATGISGIIGATLGVLAYVSGNVIAADYLNILYLPGSGELVIFAACFVGACIGFLWYNSYPAQVFMGDTGSLTLGGMIAAMAIILRKELLIPILCGIFLMENISVVLQVAWFKYTKKRYGEGRRIFKMSPLHHHYQKLGMHEVKIVNRFWIIAILLAVFTIITLKMR